MAKIFLANRESHCATCDSAIKINDHITWPRRGDSRFRVHKHCGQSCLEIGCLADQVSSIDTTSTSAIFETYEDEALHQTNMRLSGASNGNGNHNHQASAPAVTDISQAFASLASILAPMIEERVSGKVDEETVKAIVDEKLANVGTLRIEITDRAKSETRTIEGFTHENFPELLEYLQERDHVYLHGPAGSGKSTAASKAAEALGLRYGYISLNVGTVDSKLLGFIDASGTYRPTVFRDFYENGGLYCIDEADNATGNLLTTLNSALENGHCAFPDGIVARHPDFVLVATGNTSGRGANRQHSDRRPFDAAFADRFTFLHWDYDLKLEREIALSFNSDAERWIKWCQAVRAYCKKTSFPMVMVTPRATIKGARYLKRGMSFEKIAEAVVFKGLEQSQIDSINRGVTY